ncbi:MAG: Flp/Fap pilin component [Hyphomicrobiales bacterium]|nr:Flp/Fap pilin component [Hyphomicrobiales bacterium]
MKAKLRSLLSDDGGATAIEYGLLVGLLGIVITSAAGAVMSKVYLRFDSIWAALSSVS